MYIRETEQTKRLGLWLAATLLAIGAVLPVFAPAGREPLALVIGAGMVVFAAGAIGFTRLRIVASEKKLSLATET